MSPLAFYKEVGEIPHAMEQYEPVLKRLEQTAKQYTNIAPENGQFLSILIRSIQAQNVLEVGTSNGYSAIWLAAALKETGGKLITLEFDPTRAAEAKAHLQEIGLDSSTKSRNVTRGEGRMEFEFVFNTPTLQPRSSTSYTPHVQLKQKHTFRKSELFHDRNIVELYL